ncbi:MAG: diacylglycerol kinase family protein [Pseudothermotoga sp.]
MVTRPLTKNSKSRLSKRSEPSASNNLFKSFQNAFLGLIEALKRERNLKIHFAIGILILVSSYFLEISSGEMLWLTFAVFSVIGMELINTMVEGIMDVYNQNHDPRIKFVKDVAAGVVLWYSLFAVVVGLIVLGRALFHWGASLGRLFALLYVIFFPVVVVFGGLTKRGKRKD